MARYGAGAVRFSRRAPVSIEKVLDPAHGGLKDVRDDELAEYIAGWKPGTKQHIIGMRELQRRQAWSGPVRLSLAFSFVALALSVVALIWR